MGKIWLKNYPEGVAQEINPDEFQTIGEVLKRAANLYGDNLGYTSVNTAQTYKETLDKVMQFASFLQNQLQIQKGDRIAIMLPNCLQYPIAVYGALEAGGIVVNVNPLYTAREIIHQLADAEPTTIVIIENFAHTLEKALSEIPSIKHIVLCSIGDQLHSFWGPLLNFVIRHIKKVVPKYQLPNTIKFNAALKLGQQKPFIEQQIDSADLAFIQYTGGTTGIAKGAMLTHRNICANLAQAVQWMKQFDINYGDEICITPLPLYHIFSMTVNMLMYTYIGGQNVLIANPMDTKTFVRQLKKYKMSGMTAVNTLFNSLLKNPHFKEVDFSKAKIYLGGGAAIQQSVNDHWMKVTGLPILEAYGLTETSPGVAVATIESALNYPGSTGVPLPSTDIEIRDDEGQVLAIDQPGNLWVKGPQVMKGYWKRPNETAQVLVDGWLDTGDVAKIDKNGFLYIVDRKKDLIIVSGFNVYPNEVEEIVMMHPDVVECACISVPSERSGEALKVFVVSSNPNLQGEEITKFCRKYLTRYKVPKLFEFREDLPKSLVGKILRKDLRAEEASKRD